MIKVQPEFMHIGSVVNKFILFCVQIKSDLHKKVVAWKEVESLQKDCKLAVRNVELELSKVDLMSTIVKKVDQCNHIRVRLISI